MMPSEEYQDLQVRLTLLENKVKKLEDKLDRMVYFVCLMLIILAVLSFVVLPLLDVI